MASRQPPSSRPSRNSGCFINASSTGGANSSETISATRRAKTPAGVSISDSPPESSNGNCQRPSAAITRRASARSGVTNAALFSCAIASRMAHAIDSASISAFGAVTMATPSRHRVIRSAIAGSDKRRYQLAVASDGRMASEASSSRPCGAGASSSATAERSMPKRCSKACSANCGWLGCAASSSARVPIALHASSSSSVSRPGSTTAPFGRRATAARNLAVAGIEPVEPAAITGPLACVARWTASASIS